MSTNYYLVNKEEDGKRRKLLEFVNNYVSTIKPNFIKFLNENEIDREDEFGDLIKGFKNDLDYIYDPYQEQICTTTMHKIIFHSTRMYRSFSELKKHCDANKEKYQIEDEYENIFSWEEFIKEINYKNEISVWR